MGWLKRRLPKKRWKRVMLYLVSVLLVLLAFDIVLTQIWRRIEISPETTRITSPITAEGIPDYLQALNSLASEGVTSENNAAAGLLQVIGTARTSGSPGMTQTWCEQALPRIGVEKTPRPAMFVSYGTWYEARATTTSAPAATPATAGTQSAATSPGMQRYEDELAIVAGPWKADEHPRWKEWLSEQQPGLNEAHVALAKPRLYVPYISPAQRLTLVLLPTLAPLRALGSGLVAQANRCAGEGDWNGFSQNIGDARKLAGLVGQGPMLIEQLVAIAIEMQADRAVQAAAKDERLSAALARELLGVMEPPLQVDLARSVDIGERYMVLDAVCAISVYGSPFDADSQGARGLWIVKTMAPIHYNYLLREFNGTYDRMRDAWKLPKYSDRMAAIKVVAEDTRREANVSVVTMIAHPQQSVKAFLVATLTPALEQVPKREESCVVERELARVALGLRIYKAEQGTFPETLGLLVPGVIKELPQDGFADAPLKYRKEGDGYVLYSVGRNEKDDGGKDDPNKRGDLDLVVRVEK